MRGGSVEMRIAICSADFKQMSGHAGHARNWLVFEGETDGDATLVERVELAPEAIFHHSRFNEGHPLNGINAMLTRSAGDNLLNKLRDRGVDARVTRERDPARAARDYLAGRLAPPPPPGPMRLVCKLHDLIGRLTNGHRH